MPNASILTSNLKGNRLDVQMFGAKLDGTTDDTAAFQAALDTGRRVHVPMQAGQSAKITSPLMLRKSGSRLVGTQNMNDRWRADSLGAQSSCIMYYGSGDCFLLDAGASQAIEAITNPNTGTVNIKITGHGLYTGNSTVIAGVIGQTALNATWTVTVVDADHFTLNSATGNGVASSGGTATGGVGRDSIALEGLTIDGRNASAGANGLRLEATVPESFIEGFYCERVTIRNFPNNQVLIRGTGFDFMFRECGFNNYLDGAVQPITADLVFVQIVGGHASSQNRFDNCFSAIYTPGFWSYRLETSGAQFTGGVVSVAPVGGLGIYAKFGLDLIGTHLEANVPTDTTSIGIQVDGLNGGVIQPLNCSTFGTGLLIGNPASPSDPACGFQVGGNIGNNNVSSGGFDIVVLGGGSRLGTTINMGNSPNGFPTIVDQRDASVGISGATNANPIEITTTTPHPYITGDLVFQYGITGNLAANGLFTITVTGANTYTLGVPGSGSYTGGGNARLYSPDVLLLTTRSSTQIASPQLRGKVNHNLSFSELAYNLGADRNDGFRIRDRQKDLAIIAQLINNGVGLGELDLFDGRPGLGFEVLGVQLQAAGSNQLLAPTAIGAMVTPSLLLELHVTHAGGSPTFGLRLIDTVSGFIVGQWLTTSTGGEWSLYDASQNEIFHLNAGVAFPFVMKNTGGTTVFQLDSTGAVFPSQTSAALYGFGGDPNGNVAAAPGSVCLDSSSPGVWFKQSGSGNTVWVNVSAGAGLWRLLSAGVIGTQTGTTEVDLPSLVKFAGVTASRPAKFDVNNFIISGLINILSGNDVVCGGTGFVHGSGSGAPSAISDGVTGSPQFYGVGASYTTPTVLTGLTTISVTYVDGLTPPGGPFTAYTTTTNAFATSATADLINVPTIDGGHNTNKGLVTS